MLGVIEVLKLLKVRTPTISRLEEFRDPVFGFALTLLVIGSHLLHRRGGQFAATPAPAAEPLGV